MKLSVTLKGLDYAQHCCNLDHPIVFLCQQVITILTPERQFESSVLAFFARPFPTVSQVGARNRAIFDQVPRIWGKLRDEMIQEGYIELKHDYEEEDPELTKALQCHRDYLLQRRQEEDDDSFE